MRKYLRTALVGAIALVALAGCSDDSAQPTEPEPGIKPGYSGIPNYKDSSLECCRSGKVDGPEIRFFEYPLPDGRVVKCLWFDTYDDGSANCDWEHAGTPMADR